MGKEYTEAQKRATTKYLEENTDLIRVRVTKGKKAEYQELAEKAGLSLTAYIVKAIEAKKDRDNNEA